MKNRNKKHKKTPEKKQKRQAPKVWINPNSSFKGPRDSRGGDYRQLSPSTAARFLELADIALRSVQPSLSSARKKKAAA